ncbi:hypothetical protein C8Q80DRAFT_1222909 [Daedaleopsis nitida]|nr:hypothetical protein C8Q80DRAFT_1222976 [Daedaleopsis nitida]KAI0737320.1 hypothetical protein C8Q80DRAFT_1222909 [Daedaleopsis nitida]
MPFYENMEQYLSIKISCLEDYHADRTRDPQARLKECSDYLTQWPAEKLLERANNCDADAVLELAVRYVSGCGTRMKSVEGALYVLDALLDPLCDQSRYVGDLASPALKAQAYSLAAHAHHQKFLASPPERARIQADERRFARPETLRLGSVKHGLVSPAVLLVGFKLHDIGQALGVDIDSQMARAKNFRFLWRAISRRVKEIHAEERTRQRKASARPNRYVCAAEGCGIRGDQKAALRACAGRCPQDLKPSYCSKECQTKDWSSHKPIFDSEDKAKVLELFELGDPDDGEIPEEEPFDEAADDDTQDEEADRSRYARIINIPAPGLPGGSIEITSSTLDPSMMRDLRDAAATRM